MLNAPYPIVTVDMSYIDALVKAIAADDASVALARRYFNGDQDVYMTARVKEFLDLHSGVKPFSLNICRTVVLAVKDELSVSGFNTSEEMAKDGIKPQAKWAWDTWTANHMDAIQAEVHESALADRETFIITDYDYEKNRPRFTHNYRYTSIEDQGGDGQGCWMIYENNDVNQPAKCAVKEWVQTTYDKDGTATSNTRRNIYYPDHIEKWFNDSGTWKHYAPDEAELQKDENGNPIPEPWPIPWIAKDGKPLGIPVIHFRNVGMTPEHWDAIPIQDAANKTFVDVLASDDLTAFQMLIALGWFPTTDGEKPKADGSNLLPVGPGQFVGTRDPQGKVQVITGSDPSAMVNALKDFVLLAAQVTGTPTSRFTTTKLIASQETLKEQNTQLKKKAADRRVIYGDAWEACMEMARRLQNTFGVGLPELDETITFFTVWLNNQTSEELLEKKKFGIPEEILWAEAGYSTEQIALMKKTPEYAAKIAKWEQDALPPEQKMQNNVDENGNPIPPPEGKKPPEQLAAAIKARTEQRSDSTGEKPKGT